MSVFSRDLANSPEQAHIATAPLDTTHWRQPPLVPATAHLALQDTYALLKRSSLTDLLVEDFFGESLG